MSSASERRADLEELPVRAIAPERHRRLGAAGQRDAQVGWQVVEQRGERVEARPILEAVRVVEDQQRRFAPAIHLGHEARDCRAEDAVTRRGVAGGDRRIHGSDAAQGGDEVADEDDRVVVQRVERQPRDRARLARGPLGQDGCLAVARRGDQRHDRRSGGCEKGRNDALPIDGSRAFAGGLELGLEQRPGRRQVLDPSRMSSGARVRARSRRIARVDRWDSPRLGYRIGTLVGNRDGVPAAREGRSAIRQAAAHRCRSIAHRPSLPPFRTRGTNPVRRPSVEAATGPVNPQFRTDHGSARRLTRSRARAPLSSNPEDAARSRRATLSPPSVTQSSRRGRAHA